MRHLMLLLFILFTACTSDRMVKSESATIVSERQKQKELVLKTTMDFYHNYLKSICVTNKTLVEYLYSQKEIDHAFVKKVERLIEKSKHTNTIIGGTLGYDPILMAQDIPPRLIYSVPLVRQRSATIKVFAVWGDKIEGTIVVKLRKTDDAWKIIDIIDPDNIQ